MCKTMNKGTCFCRCLLLVEMRGIEGPLSVRKSLPFGFCNQPERLN